MSAIVIEQAIYTSHGESHELLARSPGFLDDWLVQAGQLCAAFGTRPPGVACPACVFAQPIGKGHVVVVQVADQGADFAGRPARLAFRFLVLPRWAYTALRGDAFGIAERLPPPWQTPAELPSLSWPDEPLPPRAVAEVQRVLQQPYGPELLGGSQVLLDGGRLVFERPSPDTKLVRDLWTLLPTSTRSELWPASFAFGNALRFHVLVVPDASGEDYAGYVTEEQAGVYPQGRYELHLQLAAEAGDQREVDILFGRRSRAETWRLAWILLALTVVLVLVSNWLTPPPAPATPKAKQTPPAAKKPPH
jgi:hypothetical protein